jgi:hypothetical protein
LSDFWDDVGDFFEDLWDDIKAPIISFTTTFIFSGGNLVAATAAAAATVTLGTGEGREFIGRVGEEFFDDILGMRPSTAYFWSYLVTDALITAGVSYGINKMMNPSNGQVVKPERLTPEQKAQYSAIRNDPKAMGTKVSGRVLNEISEKAYRALVVDGQVKAIVANVPIEFFGIPFPFLEHTAVATQGVSGDFHAGIGYLWWNRVCHQERMLYLKGVGVDKLTPLDLSWNFSTWLSYGIYGSYGQQGATIDNIGRAAYAIQERK